MPLPHASKSHGTIAFGFFNIHTDMLLLNELFFFADRWCRAVSELVGGPDRGEGPARHATFQGWVIEDRQSIGDLHGAIAGVAHSGFIGETYRRWPFPQRKADFKQQPDGFETQRDVAAMIEPFGTRLDIELRLDEASGDVFIASYQFTEEQFGELVAYVDRGGYPRWREESRPPYVHEMVEELRQQRSPWVRTLR